MELNEEQLESVLAGNLKGMGEEFALDNEELFRKKQIEELKKEKELLEALNNSNLEKEQDKTR